MKILLKDFLSVFKYEAINLLRARWLAFYGLFFGIFSFAILQFGADPRKAVASLMSMTLLVVPMVSVLFSAFYWYSGENFTALLLTQPMRRDIVYLARWVGVSLCLALSYFVGTLVGALGQGAFSADVFLLLCIGVVLNFIFVSLGMLVAVVVTDRMKGIGLALVAWLYFSVLHDVFVFFVLSTFQDYPIEVPGLFLMAANPIDLSRSVLLISLEYTAMMGYTGRILQSILSNSVGVTLAASMLLFWIVIPVAMGIRFFRRSNF